MNTDPNPTHVLPDYSTHDEIYQKLRARGANGWNNEQSEDYAQMLAFVAPALPTSASESPLQLLELGCGAGNFSALLAERGFSVTGVDISPTAIDWAISRAVERNVNATFRFDNVVQLSSVTENTFDVLVDSHCLHCIIGNDRRQCLESAYRVLKPGGTLVVLTMCGEVTNPQMLLSFAPLSKTVLHGGRPTRYIGSAKDITAELSDAGFLIDYVNVVPRIDVYDLDNLVLGARKPPV